MDGILEGADFVFVVNLGGGVVVGRNLEACFLVGFDLETGLEIGLCLECGFEEGNGGFVAYARRGWRWEDGHLER